MKMVIYTTIWSILLLADCIYAAAISHNANINDKKLVKLWEIKTPLDDFSPTCTFSRDGKYFLYPELNSIIIYNFRQRKMIDKITYNSTVNKNDAKFRFVAISPDNNYIAATLLWGNLKVWAYPSKKLILDCKGFEYYCPFLKKLVSSDEGKIIFTKDARHLIVNNRPVGVRVWAVKKDGFEEIRTLYNADFTGILGSRFPKSNYLILHYSNDDPNEGYKLEKYDLRTMKGVGVFPDDESFSSLSPDGNKMVCSGYKKMVIYKWKTKEKKVFNVPYAAENCNASVGIGHFLHLS